MSRTLERLSSGLRINRAADDPSGLAISERMRTQVRSMNQAIRNAQDGISLLQTAEASLGGTHELLQRMRELALYAANGTLTTEDRTSLQIEMDQLAVEITRSAHAVEFNGKRLLDGSLGRLDLQIGPNAGQSMTISIGAMDAYSLGVTREATPGAGAVVVTLASNQPTATLTTTNAVANVLFAAGGMTNGTYSIDYDNAAMTLQLRDSLGLAIGPAAMLDPFQPGQIVPVGDQNTDRYVRVQVQAPLPGGAVSDTITITGNPVASAQIVAGPNAIERAGYGFATGMYRLAYDSVTNRFQLQTGTGSAIGGWFTANAADTVTVGDPASDQVLTVKVQPAIARSGWATIAITNASPGVAPGLEIRDPDAARAAIGLIDKAITKVSGQRSELGAQVNRLEHTINNLAVNVENLTAAESRIRDDDIAVELAQFAKQQVLAQVSAAMLAQANQLQRQMVQLLLRP